MIIKSIELANYRNYESLQLSFDKGVNILYGDNAQGKTNVLEAIYLSSTTKSHKGSKDKEIIKFEQDESHIRSMIERNDMEYRVDMHLRKYKSKGIAINGQKIKKASELIGLLNVVFFSPEDLSIIKDGPSERRRFIDMELCQLDKSYLYHLNQYNKILNNRNKLLKDIYYNPSLKDTLDIWDEQLVMYGTQIIQRRAVFIEELNKIATGDKAKWDAMEGNAKAYTDSEIAKVNTAIGAVEEGKTVVQMLTETRESAVISAGEYTDAEIAKVSATVTTLSETHASDKAELVAADEVMAADIAALKEIEHVEITTQQIDELFA